MKRDFTPLFFTLVLFVFLAYFLGSSSPSLEDDSKAIFSSRSTELGGYKGIYEVIRHFREDLSRWDLPLTKLPEETGVIIIPGLIRPLNKKEEIVLRDWLKRGGNVITLSGVIAMDGEVIVDNDVAEQIQNFSEEEMGEKISVSHSVNNLALSRKPENSVEIVQKVIDLPGPIYFDEYHLHRNSETEFSVALKRIYESRYRWVFVHLLAACLLLYFFQKREEQGTCDEEEERQNVGILRSRGALFEYARAKALCERAINSFKNRRFHP